MKLAVETVTKPHKQQVEIGPPITHLVRNDPITRKPGTETLCGFEGATKIPPVGAPMDCVVCFDIASREGWRPKGERTYN